MEILVLFLFIILIGMIIALRSAVLNRLEVLDGEIKRLRQDLERKIEHPVISQPEQRPAPQPERIADRPRPPVAVATPPETEPFTPPPRPQPAPPPASPPHFTIAGSAPEEPSRPGFYERHPDLEKFIGENLVSKIGIAILVLAIGFFVKYAIDNDWIGPVGRVGIGLLCGGILIGIAHWLRNSYKAFSSVLVGGGLAVFFFSIALAYHEYHLFGQTVAFIIMLVITAFAVVLSLLYDRQELAIIALAGGFVTPFLASNGSGNYQVLFTYLLILNSGLLVIAYNKAWRLLNGLAFVFTVILFTTWLITLPYDASRATYNGAFLFATAFYILFLGINIANNIRENKKFIASDFGILLVNTCLYFGGGLYLLTQMGLIRYQGLFSASMAVFNLCISYFLFRRKKIDSNILYLLIGITMSFISLTAPIQLHGHYITLFWASEAVLLYWLYQRSSIRLIGLASFVVWAAMLVSLLMDWIGLYGNEATLWDRNATPEILPIVLNKGFITSLYTALACFVLFRLRQGKPKASLYFFAGALILFIGGTLEICYQFGHYYPDTRLYLLYTLLYFYALVLLLSFLGHRLKASDADWQTGWLLAGCLVLYVLSLPAVFDIQRDILEKHHYGGHFLTHWIGDGLVIAILYRLITLVKTGKPGIAAGTFAWLAGCLIVIFFSAEVLLLTEDVFYSATNPLDEVQRVYSKTGLPILWGLCSFAFMWAGMRYKFKPLRILSLVLFSVTLSKLFLFDIRDIPIAGKIAAFFCLGVLLLVVSFMYQRLKKIIIEDEEKKTT